MPVVLCVFQNCDRRVIIGEFRRNDLGRRVDLVDLHDGLHGMGGHMFVLSFLAIYVARFRFVAPRGAFLPPALCRPFTRCRFWSGWGYNSIFGDE